MDTPNRSARMKCRRLGAAGPSKAHTAAGNEESVLPGLTKKPTAKPRAFFTSLLIQSIKLFDDVERASPVHLILRSTDSLVPALHHWLRAHDLSRTPLQSQIHIEPEVEQEKQA